MNTDNKARLIEVVDKALSEVLILHREHADMIADNIEAAGLLSGSVGVSVETLESWYNTKRPENTVGTDERTLHLRGLLSISEALTSSPEPKGRWISEELYGDLIKALGKKHDALFARIINSPYGGNPEPGITAEALAKIEASMELMGNILDGRDMVDDEAELKIINDGFEALRTAPRAKEE